MNPHAVEPNLMMWVAVAGLVVNIIAFGVLHGADHDNLNVRGALLHVAGDMFGSVAAILAAFIIMYTGWMPADPILSILVSLIILQLGLGPDVGERTHPAGGRPAQCRP